MKIATDYMSAYIAYARGDFNLGQVVYACNGNHALFRPYPCVLSVNDRPVGPDLFAKPRLDDFWFIIPLDADGNLDWNCATRAANRIVCTTMQEAWHEFRQSLIAQKAELEHRLASIEQNLETADCMPKATPDATAYDTATGYVKLLRLDSSRRPRDPKKRQEKHMEIQNRYGIDDALYEEITDIIEDKRKEDHIE